jgi:hypothetical protein
MWSFRKWCLISICFVYECCIEFLDRLIALVLSYLIGIWSKLSPKSYKICFIHKFCAQQLPAAIYSTSVIDRATKFCFLLAQDISDDLKKWHVPLIPFLATLHLAKSIY